MMTVEGPDRGYSWVILLCCTYIQFALFGLFRSWGVIYVAVIAEYHVNREEASWPFSLCSSVFQLTGKTTPFEHLPDLIYSGFVKLARAWESEEKLEKSFVHNLRESSLKSTKYTTILSKAISY